MVLSILLVLLGVGPAAASAYLFLLALAAFRRRIPGRVGEPTARLVCLIPAHDEAALISRSVDSLRAKLLAAGWDLPPPWEGSRRRPDGQVLRWRTQDVDTGAAWVALPFAIEWDIPDGLHPGEAAAQHPSGATALRRVVVGARNPAHVREQLQLLLGDSDLYEVRTAASDGIEELVLDSPHGDLVVGAT